MIRGLALALVLIVAILCVTGLIALFRSDRVRSRRALLRDLRAARAALDDIAAATSAQLVVYPNDLHAQTVQDKTAAYHRGGYNQKRETTP